MATSPIDTAAVTVLAMQRFPDLEPSQIDELVRSIADDVTAQLPVVVPREKAPLAASAGGVLAILPTDLEQAQRLANGIIAAGVVPKAFRFRNAVYEGEREVHKKDAPNGPLILMGILKSLEVGMPPLTGLSWLLPINDRFTIWGDGASALILSKGLMKDHKKTYVGERPAAGTPLAEWDDNFGIVTRYWRQGHETPFESEFTVAMAKQAKLWLNSNKAPWLEHPERMLFNRARAWALRDGFADALNGLEIAEEVLDREKPAVDGGVLASRNNSALSDAPVGEGEAASG